MRTETAPAEALTMYGSAGVDIALLEESDAVRVSLATFEPGGTIGDHATGVPQRFAVISGSGWVRTGKQRTPVGPGDVVIWDVGEMHASGTDDGMTVVIIQSLI